MQDHHDGATEVVMQLVDQVEHVDGVREVEIGRRLVQQQESGALGEHHRDPGSLALTTRQFVDGSVG